MKILVTFFVMLQTILAHGRGYQCEFNYEKPGIPKESITIATDSNMGGAWTVGRFLNYRITLWHQEFPFRMHLTISRYIGGIDDTDIAIIKRATGHGSLYIEDEEARLDFVCQQNED